jgi:hypothetical protein
MPRVLIALLALQGGLLWAEGLAGRIVQDHSGVPVASADVKLHQPGVRLLAADMETDSEGRFRAEGLAAGEYRLEISKAGYVSATLPLRIAAGETARPSLRLVRCGAISGRVTNAAGQALPRASVAAMSRAGGALQAVLVIGARATVDDGGRYRLFNLPPGEYVVAASYGASVDAVGSMGVVPPLGNTGSGALLYRDSARPEVFTITGGEEFRNIDFTVIPGTMFSVSGKVEAPEGPFWLTLTPVDRPQPPR